MPFRKDRAIMMDVPEEYANNVKYRRTHPDILPPEVKENLGNVESYTRPPSSSRSMLNDFGNEDKRLSVSTNNVCATKIEKSSNIVRQNL